MGDKTGIEWTDATWNWLYGCSPKSPGCRNCYAVLQTNRIASVHDRYRHLTVVDDRRGVQWSGKIMVAPERMDQPLRWRKPRMVFVNSMSDVFHPDVPEQAVAASFAVMGAASRHEFQLLTKRPERMLEWFQFLTQTYDNPWDIIRHCERAAKDLYDLDVDAGGNWPLRNVWLGASVESQKFADERIPILQQVPAAVRFLSMEPLLGPVDRLDLDRIHWVIVGGESGPGARPMDPEWARAIRDRCLYEEVPFFMKQWGNYDEDGVWHRSKKETGCLLDGVDYKQWPVTPATP